MKRKQLLKVHLTATAIAVLTITGFLTATIIAEANGYYPQIIKTKTFILYLVPVLLIAMPTLGISGIRLAGKNNSPLVIKKLKTMKMIGANGLLLVCLAVYLYFKSREIEFDTWFWAAQGVEIVLGVTNLILIGSNIRTGLRMRQLTVHHAP